MAEIKSTMDIIMERTRNLTMTEEEKRALKRKERSARIKGWVSKYLDGVMDFDTLKAEFEAAGARREDDRDLLRESALESLDPAGDNDRIFRVLTGILGANEKKLARAAKSYQAEMDKFKKQKEEELREALKRQGIAGNAVLPNISRDASWPVHLAGLKDGFKKIIGSVITTRKEKTK